MHTITDLLPLLRDKDNHAATVIYATFVKRVVAMVHRRLGSTRDAATSEEIAHEVLTELILRADSGHSHSWRRLNNRHDVLQILVQQIGDSIRDRARAASAKKRGGHVATKQLESYCDALAHADDTCIQEQIEAVFAKAPSPLHRQLLHLMLQGHSLSECGAALGVHVRTVQRKLEDLTRCMAGGERT